PRPRAPREPMTGREWIIERPRQRSVRLRWRDRCVTAALWGAWCYPIEALARITAPEVTARLTGSASVSALLGEGFLADVTDAARVASILVASLLTWGSCARWRRGRERAPSFPVPVTRPGVGPASGQRTR